MARAKEKMQWLTRATLAHDHLRRMVATSSDRRHSAIFLETALLLTRVNLQPKPVEPNTNWRGWTKAQLDHLWATRGAINPRRWALEAALMLATHSGKALQDFIAEVRSPQFTQSEGQDLAAHLLAEQQGTIRRTPNGSYEAITEPVEIALPDKVEKPPLPTLHRSQRKVWERCVDLGRLHFSGAMAGHPLQPRTYPFLIGATGVGKNHLCRQVAIALDAHFLPLTFGRWLPNGAREGRPTMFTILAAMQDHERVCVFLDELDKAFSPHDAGGWERSVMNEVFALLDRQLPLDDFARHQGKETKSVGAKRDVPEGNKIALQRLWIIGCGTWQSLTQPQTTQTNVGFHVVHSSSSTSDILTQVRKSNAIPAELLARFHAEPLFLNYPAPDEIPDLLKAYGLDRLAAEAGVDLATIKFDFHQGGMRIFEALAADLLLTIQRNQTT